MKTVTLQLASLDDVKRRAREAFKGAKQGSRISFASPELLFRLITAKRWELIRSMAGAGPMTIRGAARRIGRDVKAVHGDVHALFKCWNFAQDRPGQDCLSVRSNPCRPHAARGVKDKMQYTTLGKTGLRVSVAGLGTGGFSRMGLKSGLNEDQSARLVLDAIDLGVNFIDTAPPYGTEGVVGKALKQVTRDSVVVATKSTVRRDGQWWTPERMVASLDNSLRLLGTDYIDVFNLHGIEPDMYDHARNVLAPALIEQKQKGKIRHIGLTENPIVDFTNETLKRALDDPIWEVFMVGFHMMHQGARQNVFPLTQKTALAR